MQDKDHYTPHSENAHPANDADAAEAMAHGLNTDDSLSESGVSGLETQVDGGFPDSGDALARELEEVQDKYLRLAAEFDNWKRRTAKEGLELRQTAGRDVIQELLPVLDDCERAEKMLETATDAGAVKEGIKLIINKLRSTLAQRGLRRMDSSGQGFDAELHEAITEIPAGDPARQGQVMDTIEPGYYLNDKLIRHAKVVVGK